MTNNQNQSTSQLLIFVVVCALFIASLGLSIGEAEFICALSNSSNVEQMCPPWACVDAISICVTKNLSCLICQDGHLLKVNLFNSKLSGTIPTQVGLLTHLSKLNFYNTLMSGTIPTQIGQVFLLTTLYLQNTQLSGSIPTQIGRLTYLQNINLGDTQLTGCLPALSVLSYCTLPETSCNCTSPAACISYCQTQYNNNNANKGEIVGISIAVSVVVVIFLVIVIIKMKKKNEISDELTEKLLFTKLKKVSGLPPGILWSFEEVGSNGSEQFNMKLLSKGSKSYQTVEHMFNDNLEGMDIRITEIYAVFSESLLNDFFGYYQKLYKRFNDDPDNFKQNIFAEDDPTGLRQWIIDRYNVFVKKWPWNETCQVKIIPLLHGTDFNTAKKICNTGFANLSKLDKGWYGSGIYFTQSGLYATPYFATKTDPALIISYVIPGNVYPVCENPLSDKSLVGSALKGGYQSHYIITTNKGTPVEKPCETYFSEVVIVQEAQCVPAFIIRIDTKNLQSLMDKYQREIVEPQ